jgi:hypothetical protein
MIYQHKEEGLEIKLSWKERFMFLFTGVIKFNRKGSYQYSTHFMKLISDAVHKYGDAKEHGQCFDGEKSA